MEIVNKRIRRGVFHSVPDLIKTIMDYIQHHNKNPKHLSGWPKSMPSFRKSAELKKHLINTYLNETVN